MALKENNKILGREDLKKHFRNGQIPTEYDFRFLIESMINKQDDGFRKDNEKGLVISPTGNSRKLMSFLKNVNDIDPFFAIEKDEQGTASMRFNAATDNNKDPEDDKSFFFGVNGSLGIGKRSDAALKLDVEGFTGLQGRVGTYCGTVPADGTWHDIVERLDNCSAFEVMARTGKEGGSKFAIMHATAVSAFGTGKGRKIRKTGSHIGFFWNKLNLRFRGSSHNYSLQLRTNANYGTGVDIHYRITKLWEDEKFMPKEYYY